MQPFTTLSFETLAEECHEGMPLFAIVPDDIILRLRPEETFVVHVVLNASFDAGRRTIKPWGDGRWFMEFTKVQCQKAGIAEGARVSVTLRPVADTPEALLDSLTRAGLTARWEALTKAQRRAFSEAVFAAKKPETARARIEKIVTQLASARQP